MEHREGVGRRSNGCAAALLTALLAMTGCDSPAPVETAPEPLATPAPARIDPTTQALAASYASERELRLRKLSVQASGFRDAINGLMTEPSEERLVTAQVAWQHLYRSFNEAWVILDCRASQSSADAERLARSDSFPILPGYVDGLSNWPDSGLVNDNTLALKRETLLAQQGATSELEVSLGFQVLQFLLFGEPLAPRAVNDYVIPTPEADPANVADTAQATDPVEADTEALEVPPESGEMMVMLSPAEQIKRRRQYLQVATQLLVDDLRLLGRDDRPAVTTGDRCPVDAMASATRRLLTLANLAENNQVSGEYMAPMARDTANAGLKDALAPWLSEGNTLTPWLTQHSPLRAEALQQAATQLGDYPVDALQILHAALTTRE